MSGLFITVEGTEGAGKTTNLDFVEQDLVRRGGRVVRTREPGGTELAEAIRQLLLQPRSEVVTPIGELLLMFAARAQHLKNVIKPALKSGAWVLCDRFTDATYAYQGGGRGMSADIIRVLEDLVHPDLQPDLTFYLDVSIAVGRQRISDRAHDRIEQEEVNFFERVREVYLQRCHKLPRFELINAEKPLLEVQQELSQKLDGFFNA